MRIVRFLFFLLFLPNTKISVPAFLSYELTLSDIVLILNMKPEIQDIVKEKYLWSNGFDQLLEKLNSNN